MKKALPIIVVLVAVAAIAFIVFLNKKQSPQTAGAPNTEMAQNAPSDDPVTKQNINIKKPDINKPATLPTVKIEDEKRKSIDSFIENSGFLKALDLLRDSFPDSIGDLLNDDSLPENEKAMIRRIAERMNPEVLAEEYRRTLNEKFSQEELKQLSETFNDPLVQQFTRDSQDLAMLGGGKEYDQFLQDFDTQNVPADRRDALRDFTATQMELFPIDNPMFDMAPELKNQMLEETRKDLGQRLAYATRNYTTEQIKALSNKLSNEVVVGAGMEQVKMILSLVNQ